MDMTSEWRKQKVGEIVRLQRGHDLPDSQRIQGTVPVMGSFGITGWHHIPRAKGPGVTIGRSGASIGVVSMIESDYWPLNTCLYVTDFLGNDPEFCFYWLKTLDLARLNSGSAQPSLNRNYVYELPACIPQVAEQKSISALLGSLNRRIKLLEATNRTLEAMAQAIFKSWFVDFDPVKAKAEGREPDGMDAATAALFPSTFEDSELGPIPQGWSVSAIREITSNIQYGLTTSAKNEPVGPKFLRITDIQGGRLDWSKVPFCEASVAERERYRLKAHDIVVARTGASTGENIYLPCVHDAVFASYLVRFQFKEPESARLVGSFMRTSFYSEYVQNSLGGSAQPNASAQVLAGAKLMIPCDEICRRFADTVWPLDYARWHNIDQIQTLTALRDTLLPKLMSGQIRLDNPFDSRNTQ
jgi:type I restriction enzyme S subunit